MDPRVPEDILIREITPHDVSAAARLSGELGYPQSDDAMKRNIEILAGLPDHAVFVACLRGDVTGWIHVAVTHHLATESRAEIAGLVTANEARSQGIGRRLVARAETWARDRGMKTILVRSRPTREDAHRFYLREGYIRTKTSAVFTKDLMHGESSG